MGIGEKKLKKTYFDYIYPFIEENWNNIFKKRIDDLISKENNKITKTGFKKEPGKTIADTLNDWWDSLDEKTKEDIADKEFSDKAFERDYEKYASSHKDPEDFEPDELDPDYEWDDAAWIDCVEVYVKYSKIDESIWSDMQRRAEGSDIRKEDEMTEEDFDFLKTSTAIMRNIVRNNSNPKNRQYVNHIYTDDLDGFVELISHWRDEMNFAYDNGDKIPKEVYDKIIKFVKKNWGDCKEIKDFSDKYFGDGLNESLWSDMQRRAEGSDIRKEDEPGNIKELKPVDLGFSVLWADRDLEIGGETKVLFDDVKDMVKNFSFCGWRLPSKKEADELLSEVDYTCSTPDNPIGDYEIYMNHNDNKLTFYSKCGELHRYLENKPFSGGGDGWDTFTFHKDGKFFPHSAYSLSRPNDMVKIRLVKDK